VNSPIIAAVERRFREASYEVTLNVELPAPAESGAGQGQLPIRAALVAAKFYFCWKAFSYISQNIFVAEAPDADVPYLESLTAAATQFSRQTRSPLSYLTPVEKSWLSMSLGGTAPRIKARGSYIVIPIVVTNAPHPDLLARCATKPRLIMPMFRLPSVIDATSGAMYYYRGRAIWGGAVLSEMRSVMSGLIAPTVAAAMA
jgi:hypothetical protein